MNSLNDLNAKGVMTKRIKILASDVDANQRLRSSVLFRFLQEISISHTEELGYRKDKTLDKGYLWVIARMSIKLYEPIVYDQHIVLESWPGNMMHFIYPRYYRVKAEDGKVLAEGAALWTLIDKDARKALSPQETGVDIAGTAVPDQPELPGNFKVSTDHKIFTREVRFSDIDLNGHVNNTRYLDWFDDLFDLAFHKEHAWKAVQVNFHNEIRPGEKIEIHLSSKGDSFFAEGIADGNTAFLLKAEV